MVLVMGHGCYKYYHCWCNMVTSWWPETADSLVIMTNLRWQHNIMTWHQCSIVWWMSDDISPYHWSLDIHQYCLSSSALLWFIMKGWSVFLSVSSRSSGYQEFGLNLEIRSVKYQLWSKKIVYQNHYISLISMFWMYSKLGQGRCPEKLLHNSARIKDLKACACTHNH